MEALIPIALFGWIPISIIIFSKRETVDAIIISVIAGVMVLPQAWEYDLPLISYGKIEAIAIGVMMGLATAKKNPFYKYKITKFDLFIYSFCIVSPIMTSLSNNLGIIDGISAALRDSVRWFFFFYIGRKYFQERESINKLLKGIIMGGIIYIPLCLYEVRFSPRLNIMLYGYFQHSYFQHIRYGSYRPIVFMQHGLMTSLWMTFGTTMTFGYWRLNKEKKIHKISAILLFPALMVTTILTRSMGSISICILGLISCLLFKRKKYLILKIILLFIPVYFYLRISGILSVEKITFQLSKIFDENRIQSLWFRLYQEDLYTERVASRPLLGWGGWGRSVPIDPRYGTRLGAIDAMWLIFYSQRGLFGLVTLFASQLVGPFLILFSKKKMRTKVPLEIFFLCLISIMFMFDCVLNFMNNVVYSICSGAALSYYIKHISRGRATRKKSDITGALSKEDDLRDKNHSIIM